MSWLPEALLLALLALQRVSGGEERRSGADVMRAVLSGGPGEPGFWPSRGRRAGAEVNSLGEETPPPFWAHRGRETDTIQTVPCGPVSLLPPEQPKYLLLHRQGAEPLWLNRGRRRTED